MRIALYSDLHLEHMRDRPWIPPPVEVDLVLLAGDIHSHTRGLKWAAKCFSAPIGYCLGNHEYYGAHLDLLSQMRKVARQYQDVHILERDTLVVQGVRILGCTLWSGFSLDGEEMLDTSMRYAERGINDYQLIHAANGRLLRAKDTWRLHRKSVTWLDQELSKAFDGKTIVVTHFAPHRRCVALRHATSEVSPYFVTDLSWLMKKHPISLWAYGHTHSNICFVDESGCRVVSNQRGYPFEYSSGDMGFRDDLVIDI